MSCDSFILLETMENKKVIKYISLLRGINVSGKKKIKMADLKVLYENLGFKSVKTYIQSGNVVFEVVKSDISSLELKIEKAIKSKYEFNVEVQVLIKSDLEEVINNIPFESINLIEEGSRVLVTFFKEKPIKENRKGLNKYIVSEELFVIKDKYSYIYCPDGYGRTKLSNNFLEKKLKVVTTTRNWKTISKLYDLLICDKT